jgi:predicted  nucleic acid-binding Zn-ribbon protein
MKIEALREASRRLEYLESQELPQEKQGFRSLVDDSPKEPVETVDYSEIKEELAEINRRIEQQELLKVKLENEISSCQVTLKELKETDVEQKELLQKLESTSEVLESDIKEVENNLESFLTSVDGMNTEYEAEYQYIQGLEQKVSELFADIEHLKCKLKCMTDFRSSISKAAVEEQLRRRIREEKDKNKQIKDEVKKIQFEIDVLLFKRYKDYMEADNLQIAGKKIFDLELEIDKERMKYLEDEQKLNFEQKQSKMHRDALNKTVDNISRDYRNLTSRHAEVLLEKLIFQRKSSRLEEKVQKLMSDIVKIDKRLVRIEKFQGNADVGEKGKNMQRSLFMIKRSMMSFSNPS